MQLGLTEDIFYVTTPECLMQLGLTEDILYVTTPDRVTDYVWYLGVSVKSASDTR